MTSPSAFVPLDGREMYGRLGSRYEPSPALLEAVNVALALEMPLLLTGEPGCGKTDLAWAVASVLDRDRAPEGRERELLECHVRSDTQARDLLYRYDAIRRFSDAQLAAVDSAARQRAQDPAQYVQLQPLGRALMSSHRRVVLIDEIDKAPRDLPNDLLWALDERTFEIPELAVPNNEIRTAGTPAKVESFGHPLRETMRAPGGERSLIIITSNVERQLPEPFLRRCVFFHIAFPGEGRLRRILEAHCGSTPGELRATALEVFLKLRGTRGLAKPPATAELLAWVWALGRVITPMRALDRLGPFAEWVGDPAREPEGGWAGLPALSSLLKLREDLETVGVEIPSLEARG